MVRALLAVLLVALLSGCAGKPEAEDPAASLTPGPQGGPAPVHVDASSSVPAPQWAVGQWWEWEVSFGQTTLDGTFCSIVVAADGSTYTLATENDAMAKEEAAWDVPLLGPIARDSLAFDGWSDAPWALLQFPLTDGKTWAASMPNIAWDSVAGETADLAMTARYEEAIGQHGGFRIAGANQGNTLVEADYDPSTGWFAALRFLDTDPGQEGLEIGYRAKSTGTNYTGPYFLHTATPLVALQDLSGFSDFPTEGGQPYTSPPQPHHTFSMGEGTTLYGVIGAETFAALRAIMLVDPANGHREVTAAGTPEDEQFLAVDEPGMAGEWRLVTTGAGGFSGAFVFLAEITPGAFQLGA